MARPNCASVKSNKLTQRGFRQPTVKRCACARAIKLPLETLRSRQEACVAMSIYVPVLCSLKPIGEERHPILQVLASRRSQCMLEREPNDKAGGGGQIRRTMRWSLPYGRSGAKSA